MTDIIDDPSDPGETPDDPFEGVKGSRLTMNEKNLILEMRFKQLKTCKVIAYTLGRSRKTIEKFIHSVTDSTPLATAMIRASASKLVKRVLDKADVDQVIDILSRPNIGVLKPINKQADGPQIMISVNQESLGGVQQVGIGAGTSSSPLPLRLLPAPDTLVRVGGDYGQRDEASEGPSSGEQGVESGHDVQAAPGTGLRGSPDGQSTPQGPVGVPTDSGDASPGRQRGLKRVGPDSSRVAIANKAHPRSSIHLKYDI